MRIRCALLVLPALLAACAGAPSAPPPPPHGAIPPAQVIGSATVRGRVVLAVAPPPRETIKITEPGCRHGRTEEPLSETVVANPDGTLRNVLVYVKSGLGSRVFAPPTTPAVLDQKGCVYVPHVLAVQANELVTFLNSDPTLHNVHAVARINPAFNVGMAVKGQKITRFFPKPEIVKMKCDVHSWMTSYIGVFADPFHMVTGEGGAFDLKGLPAGTYEIEAWHEAYGSRVTSVTVADGETKEAEFRFGG